MPENEDCGELLTQTGSTRSAPGAADSVSAHAGDDPSRDAMREWRHHAFWMLGFEGGKQGQPWLHSDGQDPSEYEAYRRGRDEGFWSYLDGYFGNRPMSGTEPKPIALSTSTKAYSSNALPSSLGMRWDGNGASYGGR